MVTACYSIAFIKVHFDVVSIKDALKSDLVYKT